MRRILFGEEARAKLAEGVDIMFRAVSCTLGPRGRNVLMERHPAIPPLLSKDGVTASKEVRDLGDPFLDMSCNLMREAASRTSDLAGDGTTTSIVLANAIFSEGMKHLGSGANPVALKRGIDKAVSVVVQRLKEIAIPVDSDEQIIQVGTISSNGDRAIGELVLAAMKKVGKDGIITLGESEDSETNLLFIEGMQIDRGLVSHHFITDPERMEARLDNPYILLTERKIQSMTDELTEVISEVQRQQRPILVIAGGFDGPFVVALIHNKNNGILQSAAVLAPAFGDQRKALLEDMAVLTGGYAFTEDCGRKLDSIELSDLGQASRITIRGNSNVGSTTIVGGKGDHERIAGRVSLIRTLAETSKGDMEADKYKQRLAKMSTGVAVIKVGGVTETELKEKKDRVEDAICATKAAVEEGILPGGGKALLSCSSLIAKLVVEATDRDEASGMDIVLRALESPARQIAMNAGIDPEVVVGSCLWPNNASEWGYNAAAEQYENLIAAGVIDPMKVTRVALQNAASVAAALLTTEAMIANIPDKKC
jgi:chaperonin GroEL